MDFTPQKWHGISGPGSNGAEGAWRAQGSQGTQGAQGAQRAQRTHRAQGAQGAQIHGSIIAIFRTIIDGCSLPRSVAEPKLFVIGSGSTLISAPAPALAMYCHLKYVFMEVFLHPSIFQTDCSKHLLNI